MERTNFKLIAGAPCLDFANTTAWRGTESQDDRLRSYDDLIAWAGAAALLTRAEQERLRRSSIIGRRHRHAVFGRARRLRDAIFATFAAVARRRSPAEPDLSVLNEEIAVAFARMQIRRTRSRFAWGWADQDLQPDRMLWPIAKSAADLLMSAALSRVRQCGSREGCGWLFLDMSRNRSRRWCDMRECGNRVKVRRYYRRHRRDRSTRVPGSATTTPAGMGPAS
jgi:predicted RNA-binding Zn ribbon-like protein